MIIDSVYFDEGFPVAISYALSKVKVLFSFFLPLYL